MPCVRQRWCCFHFFSSLKIVLAQRIHIIWSLARARKTEYIYIVMKPSIGNPVSWMGPGTFVGIIIFLLKNLVSLNFLFSSGFLIEIYTICIELFNNTLLKFRLWACLHSCQRLQCTSFENIQGVLVQLSIFLQSVSVNFSVL